MKLIALLAFFALPAHASISDQSLRAPTPPLARQEPIAETSMFSGQKISFGFGSGVNGFSGNIGKLYSTSTPVLDFRGGWAFIPVFSLRVGADFADHSFNAEPSGPVSVSMRSFQVASQVHPLETALATRGFDPYGFLGGEFVVRRQAFKAHNLVESDNAFGLGAGLGTNYVFGEGRAALWGEGGLSRIYFKDRYSQEYLQSGVEDMTGLMYSARLGLKYFF